MIRVFHVITHFDMGGAERVAINIAKSKSDNFEYHLIEVERTSGVFTDSVIAELRDEGIILHRSWVKNGKVAILMFWIKFLYLVLRWKPNVIHAHTEKPDLALYIWHCLFGWCFPKIKYVRTIHNTQLWNQWNSVGERVERFYNKNRANIAISESTQLCYQKSFGGSLPPIIYNGLDKVAQQKFEGIDSTKINILFAGRLEKQKGVNVMIRVFERFALDSRFCFYVVGSGTLKERVKNSLSNYDSVKMIDKIYGLSHYLASFSYLFMPSVHEGLALMPIEAAMAKVPTIINDCPGLKDTMPDGWLLSAHDNCIEDYFKIFATLDQRDRNKLGMEAYQFAKVKFSIEVMQKAYEEKYKELCKS